MQILLTKNNGQILFGAKVVKGAWGLAHVWEWQIVPPPPLVTPHKA